MGSGMQRIVGILSGVVLLVGSMVFAHATVRTELGQAESKAGASETYRVQVPVEKPQATVEVRLVVPEGLVISRFLQTPAWERSVVRDANGNITEVSWKGKVEDGEFVRFIFQATNPKTAGTLVWKIYQKYADGTVVAWDDADKDKGPASKVEVK